MNTEPGRMAYGARRGGRLPLVVAVLVVGLVAGCASPGGPPAPQVVAPCSLSPLDGGAAPASPGAPAVQTPPETGSGYRLGLTDVHTRTYAVSTANPLSTEAACRVLAAGGTAADAAVVAQAVLSLVEPQSSGIGGGGFLLYHDAATGKIDAYDGRETAPAAADGDYLRYTSPTDRTEPGPSRQASGHSIGVPGVMRMLELVQREHGRMRWGDLFAPAAQMARAGFPISRRMATSIAAEREGIATDEKAAEYFLHEDGTPRKEGELLSNPALADTLTDLGKYGADALHTGKIAADVVAAARDPKNARDPSKPRTPSVLTTEDLSGYRPVKRPEVCAPFGPHVVCGMPPPSSGGITVAATLRILDVLNIGAEKPHPAGPNGAMPTAAGAHLIAEAERLAYADRDRYIADTDFVPLPGGSPAAMLDPTYLSDRAKLVNRQHSIGTAPFGDLGPVPLGSAPEVPEHGTSQVSIVDRDGNAASFTTSVESAFGSYHMVDGFLLNNQLTDFSPDPGTVLLPVANRVQPGKRPRSSMAPTLVYARGPGVDERGPLQYVTGSPGGAEIPQYVVKTLVQALEWGAGPQAAVSAVNVGASNAPKTGVGCEHPDVGCVQLYGATGDAADLINGLEHLGHEVKPLTVQTSGLSMLERTPGGWSGGADPRREGVVLGDTY